MIHLTEDDQINWHLAELSKLGVRWDAILPNGVHLYWCTGHRHGYGDHCQSLKNTIGELKEPAQCKWCPALCPGGIDAAKYERSQCEGGDSATTVT